MTKLKTLPLRAQASSKFKVQSISLSAFSFQLLTVLLFSFYLSLVAPVVEAEVIDQVVAVVNDQIITKRDVDKALLPISAQYAAIYADEEFSRKLAEAKRNIMDKLIENKLILAEAFEQRIEVSDEQVRAEIEGLRMQFSSQDEFETVLLEQGLRITDLEENYRNQIMMQKVIRVQVRSKVVVKPTEIVDYYYRHLDDFTRPEEIKISNILIRIENETDLPRAAERAEEALALLRQGADFAKTAREHSDGPQKDRGGEIGFVSRGQMIEEIDAVIFKLKAGQISGLIKSDLGYHIVKVEDRRSPEIKELTEAQSEIENILFREKIEETFTEWIKKLREDAYISIR